MASNCRIMGMWDDGSIFLVVLGGTARDCKRRLPDALADRSLNELMRLDSLWLEQWSWDDERRQEEWLATDFLPLRPLRLRASLREKKKGSLALQDMTLPPTSTPVMPLVAYATAASSA